MSDALARKADDTWLYVIRACIHKEEDRLDAVLDDARRAHAQDPAAPGTLQCLADILLLHSLDEEAAAVLEAGLEHWESVELAFQLAAVEMERGRSGLFFFLGMLTQGCGRVAASALGSSVPRFQRSTIPIWRYLHENISTRNEKLTVYLCLIS